MSQRVRVRLESAQHIPAVRLGHHDVERNRIWMDLARQAQRLVAARGIDQPIPRAFQTGGEQLARRRIVVNDEYRSGVVN
jgi:hypothetical protein